MPRNKTGWKKHKGKRNEIKLSKVLEVPEKDELIGQVTTVKGNGRFDIRCMDGMTRMGILRGSMRKRVWVNRLDLLLVEPWEFETEKCSILHKYEDSEYDKLIRGGHLPKEFKLENDNTDLNNEENYFSFDISDSDDENQSSLDENIKVSESSSDNDINLDDI